MLNAEANVQVDITAIDALDELRKQDVRDDLEAARFLDRIGIDR